ncbi:MAG: hypothetical protein L6R39_007418 [Caloplaca ligustica]|nr:MAG: hypothetical protein L6R39_007418 [Caloplaca ligustica]
MLKDKGSWSHDWREALGDLEEHCTFDTNSKHISISPFLPSSSKRFPHNIRADKIERPPVWTTTTLYGYMVQVARSTVDRLVARQLYPKGETHTDAVADVLEGVFADPIPKYAISTDASNVALRYFFRVGKFARARDLFSRLQELQTNIHPSTYNIMLEAAADQKDLFTFTSLLKRMISHGVRPDSQSWLLFAQAVQGEEVRETIINKLIQKTAPQYPTIYKDAAHLMMPHIASKHLRAGKDPCSLVEELDKHFKPEWYSWTACQQIIDEVGIRHSTPQALTILKKLCGRGYRPTQGMLLLLLRQCSWTRAHELSIEILRLFRTEYAIYPSTQIYDVLFEQAWRSRLYNFSRVLWIHACIMGHTSFNMQEKVKQSLYVERSLEYSSHSRARYWEESAGKAITDCRRHPMGARLWDLMSRWKPAQKSLSERDGFKRTARSILNDDYAMVGQYRIRKPLDELLSEALVMDRRWAVGQALKQVPTECKCSQSINVEMYPQRSLKLADQPGLLTGADQRTPVKIRECGGIRTARCWMSPEMRSRPCVCPEYVKEGLPESLTTRSETTQEQNPPLESPTTSELLRAEAVAIEPPTAAIASSSK